MRTPLLSLISAVFLALTLSGCDVGMRELGVSEYGIRLRRLPAILGGGVSNDVINPGELVVVWPWDEVFTLDTKEKTISWSSAGKGTSPQKEDYVHTRALDGNEIALAVTVRYAVSTDSKTLRHIFQNVATSNEEIAEIVSSVARADIRTYMNELETSSFLADRSSEKVVRAPRYQQMEKVQRKMAERLTPWGIELREVSLNNHKFARKLGDGSIDNSYEQKIEEIERLEQETERERLRIASVRQKKREEYNRVLAEVNRAVADADGFKDQAIFIGDSYFEAKSNEAKGIEAAGAAEVEGIIEKVEALAGPGGEELLKMELARNLRESDPKFIVIGKGKTESSDIAVNKLDTNSLIQQLGLIEGLQETRKKPQEGEDQSNFKLKTPSEKEYGDEKAK